MDDEEQLAFFYEIFDPSLPRQGPGEDASTQRALRLLLEAGRRPDAGPGDAEEPHQWRILDVGCGNGAQTLVLARQAGAKVVAIDSHRPFLDELERRAQAAGLADNLETHQLDMADMEDLLEDHQPFDVVWAEGSLYLMDFAEGLLACRSMLKPGGYLGASELTWLRPDAPKECRDYFAAEYPEMNDVAGNLALMKSSGYAVVGHFVLPESAWWLPYYDPLASRVAELRQNYREDAAKLEMLAWVDKEIEMYRRFSAYYGYVFYLARHDGRGA